MFIGKMKKNIKKVIKPPIFWIYSFVLKYMIPQYSQVIFVASTGRSGTDSLSKLFFLIKDVYSLHEPKPIMNGIPMIEKNQGNDSAAKRVYYNIKRNTIRKKYLMGKKIYFESNHMFIKSFIEYAIEDFGDKVTVIHLYRDPIKVAMSLYNLNMIPGTKIANDWYLDYRATNNHIQIVDILEKDLKHDFYKCLWYWYEIEARTLYWKKFYQDIKFIDFRTEDLNEYESVVGLLNELNIKFDKETIQLNIGKRHNKKVQSKTSSISFEDAESMHKVFEICLKKQGLDLKLKNENISNKK